MLMRTLVKQEYDPHLLYHAINVAVELEYKVPMQKVYDILVLVDKSNEKSVEKISSQEVMVLLKALGDGLENTVMSTSSDDCDGNNSNLQAKIKELLRLLGCSLSDKELNMILKGELELDKALSKQARIAWNLIFDKRDNDRYRPNQELVDHMMWCSRVIALENVEMKIQRSMEERRQINQSRQIAVALPKNEYVVGIARTRREELDPVLLEEKRNKLRLYIAHMQGYDRDIDRDGGRGIDMTTGLIIDFGDIYIADKQHGSVIEDIEHDGIEMADIK